MNKSTRLLPFQVVYGRMSRIIIDLVEIEGNRRVNEDIEVTTKYIKEV